MFKGEVLFHPRVKLCETGFHPTFLLPNFHFSLTYFRIFSLNFFVSLLQFFCHKGQVLSHCVEIFLKSYWIVAQTQLFEYLFICLQPFARLIFFLASFIPSLLFLVNLDAHFFNHLLELFDVLIHRGYFHVQNVALFSSFIQIFLHFSHLRLFFR